MHGAGDSVSRVPETGNALGGSLRGPGGALVAAFLLAFLLLVALTLAPGGGGCRGAGPTTRPRIVVFAAASLQDVLAEIAPRFEAQACIPVTFNFGGSNALASQADASRQADVFLSASEEWMDHVEARGLVVAGSRRAFLSNRLVIIASSDSPIRIAAPEDLLSTPFRHLSLADPHAVPAGRYAKAWLESLPAGDGSAWARVAERVVPSSDVRAAMALVATDRDILGIVYRTDAATSRDVRVLLEVPEAQGPRIRYSAAVLAGPGKPAAAAQFLAFLEGDEARALFEARGFIVPVAAR